MSHVPPGPEREPLHFRTTQVDDVPEDLEPMVQLLLHSRSIEAAIQSAQDSPSFTYVKLFQALQWLRDHRVLKNAAISALIDQNQSEHVWPRSLFKFPLSEVPLWQSSSRTQRGLSDGLSPWALMLPLGSVLALSGLGTLQGLWPSLKTMEHLQPLQILFALSCLRTLQALSVASIQGLLGIPCSVRWVLSPVSFHLEATDRGHPQSRPLFSRVLIMIASLSPLALWLLATRVTSSHATGSMAVATCLWLFTELSPLTQSELTLALRDLFKSFGSRDMVLFRSLHRGLTVAWITLVGVFLAYSMGDHIRASVRSFVGSTDESLPAFGFLILLAFFAFSVLDELLQGTGALEASTVTQMRRIFSLDSDREFTSKTMTQLKDPNFFSKLPIIQFFPPDAQTHFHSTSHLIRLREGQRVFRQGDSSRDLYILVLGSLKIFRRAAGLGRDYSARIFPTSVFGELAFFTGVQRTATVIAEQDSLLVKIPHSPRVPDLGSETMRPIRNTVWALQAMSQNTTLKSLPAETLSLLLRNASYQHYEPGTTIAIQGDVADFALIVVEGEVMVSQNGTPIRTIRKGDLIGEIGLLTSKALRTATLQASTAVLGLRIQRHTFREILRFDLGLALRIEKVMLARLEADRKRTS